MTTLATECNKPGPIQLIQTPINPGVTPWADRVRLGYLNYNQFPTPVPVPANAYSCGYNCQGRIIGSNVPVPYPSKGEKLYKPNKGEEFIGCTADPRKGATSTDATPGCEPEEIVPELDEYFTAENDEGYQNWAKRRSEKESRKEATIRLEAAQASETISPQLSLSNYTPVAIPSQANYPASHYLPTTFATTNNTYGSYIDLRSNYPTVTIPRNIFKNTRKGIEPTNNQAREPRSNALDVHSLVCHQITSQKIPYNVVTPTSFLTIPRQGDVIGKREPGFTYPVYTKTGLESNRPCAAGLNLFATMSKESFNHTRAPMRLSNYTYYPRNKRFSSQQAVCVPYCMKPPSDAKAKARTVQTGPVIAYACLNSTDQVLS